MQLLPMASSPERGGGGMGAGVRWAPGDTETPHPWVWFPASDLHVQCRGGTQGPGAEGARQGATQTS